MKVSSIAAAFLFFIPFFNNSAWCFPFHDVICYLYVGELSSAGKETLFISFKGVLKDTKEGWRVDARSQKVTKLLEPLGKMSLHLSIGTVIDSIIVSHSFKMRSRLDLAKKRFDMTLDIKGIDFRLLRDAFMPQLNIKAAARGRINIKSDINRIFCRGSLYLYEGNLEDLYYFREALVNFYGYYPYVEIVNSYVVIPNQGRITLGGVLNLEELNSLHKYAGNYLKINEADPYRIKQRKIDTYHRQEHSFLSFLNKDYSLKDDFCRSYQISPHSFFIFSKKALNSTNSNIGLKADYE